jgi:hypothetical protein
MGQVYSNWRQMVKEVKAWLACSTPRMLIVGELQDGLAFDSAYAAVTGKPLTHHLIPLFAAQDRHRLIFLTKSTLIKHALLMESTLDAIAGGDYWKETALDPEPLFPKSSISSRKAISRSWIRASPTPPPTASKPNTSIRSRSMHSCMAPAIRTVWS